VTFVVTPFEDYAAPDASVDLVASATAFHWLDPQVALPKIARLLRPGGWLAVLGTRERYDDPLGAALRDTYLRHGADGGAWARRPPRRQADAIAGSGLFGEVIEREHRVPLRLPSETVLGLEHTRATSLGYDPATRASFTADVQALLPPGTEVPLEQHTVLAMAPLLAGAGA
jgi:SAM-dependent methyltransferase